MRLTAHRPLYCLQDFHSKQVEQPVHRECNGIADEPASLRALAISRRHRLDTASKKLNQIHRYEKSRKYAVCQ